MWKTKYATQIEWLLKINENVVFEKNKINNSGLMQKRKIRLTYKIWQKMLRKESLRKWK